MSKQYKTDFPTSLLELLRQIETQAGAVYDREMYRMVQPETVARLKRVQALSAAALAYIDEEEGKEGSHE